MIKYIIILLLSAFIISCGNKPKKTEDNKCELKYAQYLNVELGNGYHKVTVVNPWKDDAVLQTYVLVPQNEPLPTDLPKGVVIRTPLKRAVVYSCVHSGAINEVEGDIKSIAGVCDAIYFNDPKIKADIESNRIIDCGNSMAPTLEKIIELKPDAIILSPFQNAGYGALTTLGVPIIEFADYMEHTPLGRAEWIKFFGLLYNNENTSDSIFDDVEKEYLSIKKIAKSEQKKPKVITEMVMKGVWYVPGGDSYMSHIISDAGGEYPWKEDKSSGSLQLDFTQVFDKAHDADIWLVKTYGVAVTHKWIADSYSLNVNFDAYKGNGIYACDTKMSNLFNDFPFHPEILLKEYIAIFHPDVIKNSSPKYFRQVVK